MAVVVSSGDERLISLEVSHCLSGRRLGGELVGGHVVIVDETLEMEFRVQEKDYGDQSGMDIGYDLE